MSSLFMDPARVARVAGREFASTALTKGFIIGVFIVPAIIAVVMPLLGYLVSISKPPPVEGRLAIIDRSGLVAPGVADRLERLGAGGEQAADSPEPGAESGQDRAIDEATDAFTNAPRIEAQLLPDNADPDAVQSTIREQADDESVPPEQKLVGLLVIDPDAVVPEASEQAGTNDQPADPDQADPDEANPDETGGAGDDGAGTDSASPAPPSFGGFQLYTKPRLDARVARDIERAVTSEILRKRYDNAGYDPATLRALTTVNERPTREITQTGTRESNLEAQIFVPAGFMLLIMVAVFTGGQYLLTTTIEEKSSRVIEVLLSAVSATELMTGKILGQMLVGLVLIAVYAGLGVTALIVFSLTDLIQPRVVAVMPAFFIFAYLMIASLMAAIGSAVNELREAQSLMTPVMLIMAVPYFLFMPISLSPNAAYSVALSMIPPISPFVMMLRVASNQPPPLWQVLLSIAFMTAGALFLLWFAGKIFRVGLLMFGKPPNILTLIKWVRMA